MIYVTTRNADVPMRALMFNLRVNTKRALGSKVSRADGTGQRRRLMNAMHVGAQRMPRPELLVTGGADVLPVQVLLLHVVPEVGPRGADVCADAATPERAAAALVTPSLGNVRQ